MSAPPPSFTSFPPVFNSFPDLEAGPSTQDTSSSRSQEHKKTKNSRKHSERDWRDGEQQKETTTYHDERRKKRSKKHRREKGANPDNDIFRDSTSYPVGSTADLASRSFYSDRKGDTLNITYGGLHAGDVPKHHLLARGRRVLGLNDAYVVIHRSHRGIELDVASRKRRLPELTDPKARRLLQAPTRRFVAASEEHGYKYEEVDGFLRLPSAKSAKKDIEAYRDITAHPNLGSDMSDSSTGDEEESGEEDSDFSPLDARQATLKEIEERLASDPTSIPTWLALLTNSLSTVPLLSKNAPKVRAEISLSVLSRALDAHVDNKKSLSLRLKLLSVGEELWGDEKLYEEWEDALKVGNAELWIRWLDWRIRTLRNGVDGIVHHAQRVLASLGKDEVSKLRVLWRVAIAFRNAGFVERAMALLQAQSELTFKRPGELAGASVETALDRLESFWELEVPRAGEPGAIGWAAWEAAGSPEAIPIPSRVIIGTTCESDPYARWANEECLTDSSTQVPLRSFDDEAANDPYSIILFSDLRPLLVDLTYTGSKQAFRLLWLSFLGLHLPGFCGTLSGDPNDSSDDRWSATHLANSDFLDRLFPEDSTSNCVTSDSYAGVLVGRERPYSHAFGPVKQWSFDVVGAFDVVADGRCRLWSREDARVVEPGLVGEVFRQCRLSDKDTEWDLLHLAFEGAIDPKQALKISKGLVSKFQGSLLHWRAHARLERLRGRLEDARKVYRTVSSAANADDPSLGQFWWDWAEMEWLNGAPDAALQVALRSTKTNGSGNVVILRSKRELDDIWKTVSDERWKEKEAWVNLRALLELLTSSPSSILPIFDSALSRVPEGGEEHESLTIASLYMLYAHGSILRRPIAPGILRERAERSIRLYPANTIILAMFLEAEKGQGVWGQVKMVLGDKDSSKSGLLQMLAELWALGWEKGSWKAEEERIRNRLSAAVQNDGTRGSAILWRIYLDFEMRTGRSKQAKLLLFRAIRECPMVKGLYLLAFGPLRSLFTPRELNELGDTMAERGIRTRRALDEAVEGWVESNARLPLFTEDDVERGEEEIEYNARELRRLRPY